MLHAFRSLLRVLHSVQATCDMHPLMEHSSNNVPVNARKSLPAAVPQQQAILRGQCMSDLPLMLAHGRLALPVCLELSPEANLMSRCVLV